MQVNGHVNQYEMRISPPPAIKNQHTKRMFFRSKLVLDIYHFATDIGIDLNFLKSKAAPKNKEDSCFPWKCKLQVHRTKP